MKLTIFILTLLLSFNMIAQENNKESKTYLRVYDLSGKKIAKGKLYSTTSSTLSLRSKKEIKTISIDSVGSIKTKRSVGHNILIGSSVGASTVIFLSVGSDESFTEGYTGIGTILFTGVGAGVGAISSIFKNSKTFHIDADVEKWEVFRKLLINQE